jgi:hypothetical protein
MPPGMSVGSAALAKAARESGAPVIVSAIQEEHLLPVHRRPVAQEQRAEAQQIRSDAETPPSNMPAPTASTPTLAPDSAPSGPTAVRT